LISRLKFYGLAAVSDMNRDYLGSESVLYFPLGS